jgi:hypothetical protein
MCQGYLGVCCCSGSAASAIAGACGLAILSKFSV